MVTDVVTKDEMSVIFSSIVPLYKWANLKAEAIALCRLKIVVGQPRKVSVASKHMGLPIMEENGFSKIATRKLPKSAPRDSLKILKFQKL